MLSTHHKQSIGIVGGLGMLAGADLFFKLAKAIAADRETAAGHDVVFEQQPFQDGGMDGEANGSPNRRKLYVFDMIRKLEARGVHSVLLPCFISHTFLGELQAETPLPLVSIMDALLAHLRKRHPAPCRIGVLASNYVKSKGLFERYFAARGYEVVYPDAELQDGCVMPAIYGGSGVKSGHLQGEPIELLHRACEHLLEKGAQAILPGATEIAVVSDALQARGVSIVDANRAYVQYALSCRGDAPAKPFKVGVIGGVGPAATVDFLDKIVRNTAAGRDQDHIKLVLEHNPQIPDRTAALIGDGPDPTLALYAACKKLEAGDADLIAIPCNTAHAFVERIQPYLSIPIVNMLFETARHIADRCGNRKKVGLLATSGTIASRVYQDVADAAHLMLLTPDDAHQALVMEAIYGERGVKAGYLEGACREQLMQALAHLAERGAEVIILGCTELPLLIAQSDHFSVAGESVMVLDPTDILARRCVSLSRAQL
ncbi:aspartate/glutamate racemase family protein [Oxalobacteraceae bacterium CAVE-383]|nr:aspartate/glutamate racemase family protein [Oxalobacteraceae bacterium CAVE-383]